MKKKIFAVTITAHLNALRSNKFLLKRVKKYASQQLPENILHGEHKFIHCNAIQWMSIQYASVAAASNFLLSPYALHKFITLWIFFLPADAIFSTLMYIGSIIESSNGNKNVKSFLATQLRKEGRKVGKGEEKWGGSEEGSWKFLLRFKLKFFNLILWNVHNIMCLNYFENLF